VPEVLDDRVAALEHLELCPGQGHLLGEVVRGLCVVAAVEVVEDLVDELGGCRCRRPTGPSATPPRLPRHRVPVDRHRYLRLAR
jgi:hypothetical protein